MGQITYNTIFSEIQKYMLMMQWAETLIRYLKDKGYAENDEKIPNLRVGRPPSGRIVRRAAAESCAGPDYGV